MRDHHRRAAPPPEPSSPDVRPGDEDEDDETPTPPRNDWFALRPLHELVDEEEPLTPRMNRPTAEAEPRPSFSSLIPPLGVTIPPSGSPWGRATVVAGTVFGVVALLGAYSFTLATDRDAVAPLQRVLAAAPLDLGDAEGRAEGQESIEEMVRAYAPVCIGHRPDKILLVVRGNDAGHLEVISLPNVVEPTARRCLVSTLGEVVVQPSLQAFAPWSIEVQL